MRLSDPAWLKFQNDVDVNSLNLPPWGGVVAWEDSLILVFVCQADGTMCRKGEVMLTDISDRAHLLTNVPRQYDVLSQMWWYNVPSELMNSLLSPSDVLEATGKILTRTAEIVGETAAAAVKPALDTLTLPLIVIGALALIFLFGGGSFKRFA
jgi:hypothetical protein